MTQQANAVKSFFDNLGEEKQEKVLDYLTGSLIERLGISPNLMRLAIRQARLKAETGNIEEAMKFFGTAIIMEPSNVTYLGGFANCALMLGMPEAALQTASTMVMVDPKNPVGYALSGAACRMLGKLKEAAEDFEDAKRLAVNSPEVAQLVSKLQASMSC